MCDIPFINRLIRRGITEGNQPLLKLITHPIILSIAGCVPILIELRNGTLTTDSSSNLCKILRIISCIINSLSNNDVVSETDIFEVLIHRGDYPIRQSSELLKKFFIQDYFFLLFGCKLHKRFTNISSPSDREEILLNFETFINHQERIHNEYFDSQKVRKCRENIRTHITYTDLAEIENILPNRANSKYISFILEFAFINNVIYSMAATLPCLLVYRNYYHFFRRLENDNLLPDYENSKIHNDWINSYVFARDSNGDNINDSYQIEIEKFHRLLANINSDQDNVDQKLTNIFLSACNFELEFMDSLLHAPS